MFKQLLNFSVEIGFVNILGAFSFLYHLLQLEETSSHICSILLKKKDPSQVMINVSCRGVSVRVQVCRRELHTHIHLDYVRIEFLSCIYIYIY